MQLALPRNDVFGWGMSVWEKALLITGIVAGVLLINYYTVYKAIVYVAKLYYRYYLFKWLNSRL